MFSPTSSLVELPSISPPSTRQLVKDVIGTRSCIEKVGLEVVRLLKKIITILTDISMTSNESYNCHLDLTSQMMFYVRNLYVYPLFSFVTILPNIFFRRLS
jgi:hypothetical protein